MLFFFIKGAFLFISYLFFSDFFFFSIHLDIFRHLCHILKQIKKCIDFDSKAQVYATSAQQWKKMSARCKQHRNDAVARVSFPLCVRLHAPFFFFIGKAPAVNPRTRLSASLLLLDMMIHACVFSFLATGDAKKLRMHNLPFFFVFFSPLCASDRHCYFSRLLFLSSPALIDLSWHCCLFRRLAFSLAHHQPHIHAHSHTHNDFSCM